MDQAARQFLRAIRGSRSQVAFARRLGYRGNPITDWENGRRCPTAREALRACARVGVDVRGAAARFQPTVPLGWVDGAPALAPWLDALRGTTSMREVAERTGASRFAVGRWLAGRAQPRVADFFRLVDAITGRLPDLVAELVPIDEVPALAARHGAALAARTIAVDQPWTEAVLRVLETPAYRALPRHQQGFAARRLGLDLDTERHCLRLLERAGILRRVGRRWTPIGNLTVETRSRPEAMRTLRAHWARVSLARAERPGGGDSFSYNLCSLSHADRERVRELLRATFREIRSIVAASEPPETVALVLMHLVAFDDEGAPESAGARSSP